MDKASTMPTAKSDARISFRLSSELKKAIEDAAAEMGQSVSDFAVSTLVQSARKILHDQQSTRLSERDRQLFVAALDDEASKPNEALVKAAKRYKKQVG
jgi:uncharacterized protein (DUF1778 family)